MLQQLIAFLVLISHINTSMLLPQVAEDDMYCDSLQVDDINSLYEYVDEIILGNIDSTPEDEDDDRGQNFKPTRFGDEICEIKFRTLQINQPDTPTLHEFFESTTKITILVAYDILTPPPKA
jgi:hypothetical protein